MEPNGVEECLVNSNNSLSKAISKMGEAFTCLAASIEEGNLALLRATSPVKAQCPPGCQGYTKNEEVDDEEVAEGPQEPPPLDRTEVLKAIAEWLHEVDKGEASTLWALGEIARIVERELGAAPFELLNAGRLGSVTEHMEAAKLFLVIRDVNVFLRKHEHGLGYSPHYAAAQNIMTCAYRDRIGRDLTTDLGQLKDPEGKETT